MTDEIIELRKLVFELTLINNANIDLDQLLARVLDMLRRFPSLHLCPQSAILLFNPAGRPIQVAQHGLTSTWPAGFDWDALRHVQQPSPSIVSILSCTPSPAGTEGHRRFLALPLFDDGRRLGYATILLDGNEDPDASRLMVLADLARALSGLVTRALLDQIVEVREWELEESRTEAIHRLSAASEYRDNDTGWHVMRMTNYALAIARHLGLPEEQRDMLFITAPMHDVGKIGIPDSILLKPARLTAEEREIMNRHTEIGETILKGSDELITAAREIAGAHHERWDGLGYPRRLRGEEIPILARICAVADVFDALTTSRPYKTAWPVDDAVQMICDGAGTQFDPAVVEAFGAALPEISRIRELYRDDIIDPTEALTLPPPVGRDHEWVTWDDSLSVGIDVIDEHHRHLFDLVNDIYAVVADKRGARELARMIKALDLYAQVHFRAEERMMEHYGYAGAAQQKDQHQRFEARLREFHDELHVNPLTARHDVLEFARDWLVMHILHEDTQLRELASTTPTSR